MQPIPRFWARRSQVVSLPDNPELSTWLVQVWGCSADSQEEAERDADARLSALVATGGPRGAARRTGIGDEWYYPQHRRPEEIIREIHDGPELVGVVTRNRYGAEVLNTDELLITGIDISAREEAEAPAPRRRGLLSRLFGGGTEPTPEAQAAPTTGMSPAEVEILQRIDAFARSRPELGISTYRTAAGFRLFLTGTDAGPDSETAAAIMAELGSDPLYATLCRAHATYRARLTPKPWRIDMEMPPLSEKTPLAPPPPEWMSRYNAASDSHAVCSLVGRTGAMPSPREQLLIDEHDAASGVDSGRPLA